MLAIATVLVVLEVGDPTGSNCWLGGPPTTGVLGATDLLFGAGAPATTGVLFGTGELLNGGAAVGSIDEGRTTNCCSGLFPAPSGAGGSTLYNIGIVPGSSDTGGA